MNDNKQSPVAAGLIAAGVGAAVGAAAVLLSDKDRRDKIVHKAKDVQDRAKKAIGTMKSAAEDTVNDVKADITSAKKEVTEDVQDALPEPPKKRTS